MVQTFWCLKWHTRPCTRDTQPPLSHPPPTVQSCSSSPFPIQHMRIHSSGPLEMLISVLVWPSYPFHLQNPTPTPILQSPAQILSFLILYSELVVSYSTSNIFIIENHYTVVVKSPHSQVRLLEFEY